MNNSNAGSIASNGLEQPVIYGQSPFPFWESKLVNYQKWGSKSDHGYDSQRSTNHAQNFDLSQIFVGFNFLSKMAANSS